LETAGESGFAEEGATRMHPRDYLRELVEPAIKEFEAEPDNVRRAYTACLFAYHFADAVAVHGKPKDKAERDRYLASIREELASSAPSFRTVEGIANMMKHVELDRGKVRPKMSDTHVSHEERLWVDAAGNVRPWLDASGTPRPWLGPPEVMTRDSQGNRVNLRRCIQEVRLAITAYLDGPP
jgi:hypothetical protein